MNFLNQKNNGIMQKLNKIWNGPLEWTNDWNMNKKVI